VFDEIEGRHRAELVRIERDGVDGEVRGARDESEVARQLPDVHAEQLLALVRIARAGAASEVEVGVGSLHRVLGAKATV